MDISIRRFEDGDICIYQGDDLILVTPKQIEQFLAAVDVLGTEDVLTADDLGFDPYDCTL